MTALERALVVYAEAKGYEIEVGTNPNIWHDKETCGLFNFSCKYRIKNKKDYRKVYDELSDFFKPLYTPEQTSKLLSDMERAKYKPSGFSCKTKMYTREEIEEMNKAEEKTPETHKFTLDMKFKVGDKVKVKPSFNDDGVYTIYGFECSVNANNQCHLIMYQLLTSEGEFGKWTREDALELYKPEAIPATEEEIQKVDKIINKVVKDMVHDNILFVVVKTKRLGSIYPEFYSDNTSKLDKIKEEDLIYDEQTKTWQDWSSK